MKNNVVALIMAGGLGKRMESNIPKVLHEVYHPTNSEIQYPMIILVILAAGLYGIFTKKSQLEQAKETLEQINSRIEILDNGEGN